MTKYCTEAWLLLSLVANKMKSSNPDGIAAEFIKQITQNMVRICFLVYFDCNLILMIFSF